MCIIIVYRVCYFLCCSTCILFAWFQDGVEFELCDLMVVAGGGGLFIVIGGYFVVFFFCSVNASMVLPEYTSSFTLASTINMFFIDKINTIKMEFPLLDACLPVYSFVDIDIIMPACTAVFDTFHPLSCDVLSSLISKLNKTTCVLDPFPTKLLMSHLFYIIDIILCIVNLCFSSGVFPTACKSSIIFPLIKKQGLDPEILKNYRPVANLSFISKIIEKAIATQIHDSF